MGIDIVVFLIMRNPLIIVSFIVGMPHFYDVRYL
jgi:hypothetical protein